MRYRPRLVRIVFACGLVLPASACTRTYDGSIVPVYQPQVVRAGLMPRVEMRRTATEPDRRYEFPSAPKRTAAASPRDPLRTGRRPRAVDLQPRVVEKTVRCSNVTSATGRVRVVCS